VGSARGGLGATIRGARASVRGHGAVFSAAVVAFVVLSVACSGPDSTGHGGAEASRPPVEDRDGASPATGSEPPDMAWSFVRLIAGQGEGTDLGSVASPASPAFLYGLHHLAALEMNRPSDYSIEPVGADLRACDAMACFTFGGFRIDRDGRIRTFSVDDQPVDGRVTSGHRLGATAEGVTVVVKTAVVSTRGHLNVVFEVTNDRSQPLTTLPDRARYLPVDGTPVASPEDVLREPFEIPPGALLRTMAVFDHSRFGGTLVFVGQTGDGTEVEIEVAVPTADAPMELLEVGRTRLVSVHTSSA
jgi:hypothetical protein